jgi:hypothetical protein
MQKQYDAGNYKGMLGTAAGFVSQFAAPEAIASAPEMVQAGKTAVSAAQDAATAAGAGIRAAAPDVAAAAAKGAAGWGVSHVVPGVPGQVLETVLGLRYAGQAGKGLLKGAGAAADAWADARAARVPEVPPEYWDPSSEDWARDRQARGVDVPEQPPPGPQQWRPAAEDYARQPAPQWDPHVPADTTGPPAWEPYKGYAADPRDAPAEWKVVNEEPIDTAPDARATLPPELVDKVDALRALTHDAAPAPPVPSDPALRPPARGSDLAIEDWITKHTAYMRLQAQEMEWGNRAAKADRVAGYLIKNGQEATPENIAAANKAMGEPRIASTDETVPMIQDRVDWHNGKQAQPAPAAEAQAAPADLEQQLKDSLAAIAARKNAAPVELKSEVPAAAPETPGTRSSDETGDAGSPGRLQEDAGGSPGQSGPVFESSRPGQSRVRSAGDPTTIDVPGEERDYAARYEVRPRDEVHPSHNAQTFTQNPQYEYANDRNYDDARNQRKVVDWSVEGPTGFKERNLINTAPDASSGPPIIDARGNVLGGNGRSMILSRVYDQNPAAAARYRAELDRVAQHFGIDPASYAHMQEPVLVRRLADGETDAPGAAARAITDFNKTGTAALTPAERAIADSRGVSLGTLDDIAKRMEDLGPDSTLLQALEGRGGTQVLDQLTKDGVISPQEGAALRTPAGGLTRGGKERISGLMLGRFFENAQQLDDLPASLRNKMERLAAPLARVEGSAEYSLSPHVKEALNLIEDANAHGAETLDDFLQQQGLFGSKEYSPEAVTFARQLQTRNPVDLTHALRRYVARAKYAAEYQGPGLSGEFPAPLSPREAFEDSFEDPAPAKK